MGFVVFLDILGHEHVIYHNVLGIFHPEVAYLSRKEISISVISVDGDNFSNFQ